MLSSLPRDVAEDVLSRLPVTSLRGVRFTSKKWNRLSKKRSFKKKHIASAAAAAPEKEFMAVMMVDYWIHMTSFNLHGSVDLSVSSQAKLVSLTDSDQMMNIFKVYHCDGLLLCLIGDRDCRFVVWNPYLGQTRWFQPPKPIDIPIYAIGYENTKSCERIHKVLRFSKTSQYGRRIRYELYYLNSMDTTTTFPITFLPDWEIEFYANGVSVKGNTYWYAKQNRDIDPDANADYFQSEDYKSREALLEFESLDDFLICFDFTTETFGPRLPLPFHSSSCEDTITLSSVRDEQLAVLFQLDQVWNMEIWITTKIDTQELSWSIFLRVDMNPRSFGCRFVLDASSFFVDEEKKVAMVIKNDARRCVACIIGEDAYFRKVDLGISAKVSKPLLCPYVPSSVQITKHPRVSKRIL